MSLIKSVIETDESMEIEEEMDKYDNVVSSAKKHRQSAKLMKMSTLPTKGQRSLLKRHKTLNESAAPPIAPLQIHASNRTNIADALRPAKDQSRIGAEPTRTYQRKKGKNFISDLHFEPRSKPEPSRSSRLEIAENIPDSVPYTTYHNHTRVHREFRRKFTENPFGDVCDICDLLTFRSQVTKISKAEISVISSEFPGVDIRGFLVCRTCSHALKYNRIPLFSKSNGFTFPEKPPNLPELDLISQRLISPRLPFAQIRRFQRTADGNMLSGELINVPAENNPMVRILPRKLTNDHSITVQIQKTKVEADHLMDFIQKPTIKAWLDYLCTTPLYRHHKITIDETFFNDPNSKLPKEQLSSETPMENSFICQQQTLLWNEAKYIRVAREEYNSPKELFDNSTEELSFPIIYLGTSRTFKEDVNVTPYVIATSEIKRRDRRAVTPQHLLYLSLKIMRLRTRQFLAVFKHSGAECPIAKEQSGSDNFLNECLESNVMLLRHIPNSIWYWEDTKRDLFAMLRQLGKPTIFLTLEANEVGWMNLLSILHKLKHGGEMSSEMAADLSDVEKSTLINEDLVTCAIYFNKMISVLIEVLQMKQGCPFGEYRLLKYFKRIEFKPDGSPRAHLFMWLDQAPKDPIGVDRGEAIALIDSIISVSTRESSGMIKLQKAPVPLMPCDKTSILTPLEKSNPNYQKYSQHYERIRENLRDAQYSSMNEFYLDNGIESDKYYADVLRTSISKPTVFLKRKPSEKLNNAFNPFILNILQTSIGIQFIVDESTCADHLGQCITKTNPGMSHLQKQIVDVMEKNPECGIADIMKKMNVDLFNSVEISGQEAAWYLLGEPMSESSSTIAYIPTVRRAERLGIQRIGDQLTIMELPEYESIDMSWESWFENYQMRPVMLEDVTLAQYVANWQVSGYRCTRRKGLRVIRYRNYDKVNEPTEYKREMVTLHHPFRNEVTDILAQMKFLKIYQDNEDMITKRSQEFESDFDVQKMIDMGQKVKEEMNDSNLSDPLQTLCNSDLEINYDLELAMGEVETIEIKQEI